MTTSPTRLRIFESEANLIVNETAASADCETGGALYGLWSHQDTPVVLFATGPHPSASRGPVHFHQDPQIHMVNERYFWDTWGLQCLGIWHSHHRLGLHELSDGDRARTRQSSSSQGRPRYAEILTYITDTGRRPAVHLKPHVYADASQLVRRASEIEVLVGESPIRNAIRSAARRPPVAAIESMGGWPGLSVSAPALGVALESTPPYPGVPSPAASALEPEPEIDLVRSEPVDQIASACAEAISAEAAERPLLAYLVPTIRLAERGADLELTYGSVSDGWVELCIPLDEPHRMHATVTTTSGRRAKYKLQREIAHRGDLAEMIRSILGFATKELEARKRRIIMVRR